MENFHAPGSKHKSQSAQAALCSLRSLLRPSTPCSSLQTFPRLEYVLGFDSLLRGFCTAPFTLTQLPGGSAVPLCEGAEPWFGPSSMILPSLGICSVKRESESSWDSTGNLSHPQSHKEAACDPNMLEFAILRRRSADIKGCGTDTSWEFTPAFP